MDYTHILCVKIWSNNCNSTVDYNNIESKVKYLLTDTIFTEIVELEGTKHNIPVTWSKKSWETKQNYLINGDLVTNFKYSSEYDQVLNKHTELVLMKIQAKLKEENVFHSDWEIIFNIVKQLATTKPRVEYVGLWHY